MVKSRSIEWSVASFLVLNPVFAVIGLAICAWQGTLASWGLWLSLPVFFILAAMGITAGYHRYFAHRSYDVHPWVEAVFLFFGAANFQGSCLKWCSDHRRHHGEVDTDGDPYSIKKGFWYAHIGWLFFKESVDLPIEKTPDLERNPRVVNQHKYYLVWAIAAGYLLPMLIGAAFGSAFAGLVILGAFRIFLNQHTTFFVNSLCHTLGRQTYSKDVSARDSFIVAVLTQGEGYHSFHHTFQFDFRNGIRWYQWDPTKWTILGLKWMGLAKRLRTVSPTEILKARLQAEAQRLSANGLPPDRIEQMKSKVLEAQARWKKMKDEYAQLKREYRAAGRERIRAVKLELYLAKLELRYALAQWQATLQMTPVRIR